MKYLTSPFVLVSRMLRYNGTTFFRTCGLELQIQLLKRLSWKDCKFKVSVSRSIMLRDRMKGKWKHPHTSLIQDLVPEIDL